jgi:uncharacterized protein (TIGR02145 family)
MSKLKETGTTHWISPNTATNETGFTALPGGYRYDDSGFDNFGIYASFWSTTENSSSYSWFRFLKYDNSTTSEQYGFKELGFSVRCVKD